MSENTGGLFEEVKGSDDSQDTSRDNSSTNLEQTVFASLDIPTSVTKPETKPDSPDLESTQNQPKATVASLDLFLAPTNTEPKTELASLDSTRTNPEPTNAAFKAVYASNELPNPTVENTTSSLPRISIDTSAVTRSTTVPIAPRTEKPRKVVEDAGFLTGLKNTSMNMVTGMASLVTNENKTFEEKLVNPDQKMTDRLGHTGATLGTVVLNVGGDLTGLGEDTKTASAIGTQLSDHWTKMKSGNMEAWGNTTAFAGSLILPGSMAAKGGKGLIDDGVRATKTLQTAQNADDLISMANKLKGLQKPVRSLADDSAKLPTTIAANAKPSVNRVPSLTTNPPKPSLAARVKTGFENNVAKPVREFGHAIDEALSPTLQPIGPGGITIPRSMVDDGLTVARTTVKQPGSPLGIPYTSGRTIRPAELVSGTTRIGDDLTGAGSKLDDLVSVPQRGRVTKPGAINKADDLKVATGADDAKAVVSEPATVKPTVSDKVDEVTTTAGKPVVSDKVDEVTTTAGKPVVSDKVDEVTTTAGKPVVSDKVDEVTTTAGKPVVSDKVDEVTTTAGKPAVSDKVDEVTTTAGKPVVSDKVDEVTTTAGKPAVSDKVDEVTTTAGKPVVSDKVDEVTTTAGKPAVSDKVDEVTTTAGKPAVSDKVDEVTTTAGKPAVSDKVDEVTTTAGKPAVSDKVDEVTTTAGKPAVSDKVDEVTTTAGKPAVSDKVDEVTTTAGKPAVSDKVDEVTTTAGKPAVSDKVDEVTTTAGKPAVSDKVDEVTTTAGKPAVSDKVDEVTTTAGKPAVSDKVDEVTTTAGKPAVSDKVDEVTTTAGKPAEQTRLASQTPKEVVANSTRNLQTLSDDATRTISDTAKSVDRTFNRTTGQAVKRDLTTVENATKQIASGKATPETIRSLDAAMANLSKTVGEKLPAQFDDITRHVDKVKTTSEVTSTVIRSTDELTTSARQLATTSDEFVSVIDDVATRTSTSAQTQHITNVRTLTQQVKAGSADALTINRLNTSVRELGKTLGPDDAKRLVDKVDELTTSAQKSNITSALTRQTTQTADNFSTLSSSLDDVASRVANKSQIEEVRILASEVAKGSTEANTIVKLNNAVKSLKGSLDPTDFNTITTRTNNLTRSARQATTTRELARTVGNASDNVAQVSRQLTSTGDDFARVLDDVSSRTSSTSANTVKQELDNVGQLSNRIREGATDANTLTRFNTAVRELGEKLGPSQADDFAKIVKSADDLSIAAQRSIVTRELANQTARVGNSFTSTTKVLDDISAKIGPSSTNASRNIETVRNLTEKIANGTASKNAVTRLNKAVTELGESLGPKFSDDLSNLTTRIDDLTQASNRTNVIKEVSTKLTKASDEIVSTTRQLQTSSQAFSQTLDDVATRVKTPAGSTAETVTQNVRTVRELSRKLSAGTADDATIAQLNTAVRDLSKALGPDDFNNLVTKVDDLTVSARQVQITRDVTRQINQAGDRALQASKLITTSADEVSNTLRTLTREVTETTSGSNVARLHKDIKSIETATRKIANGTADAKTVRSIESTLTRLNKTAGTNPHLSSHIDDLGKQLTQLTRSHRQSSIAREVASNVSKSGDELLNSTKTVASSVSRVEQTVNSLRKSITESADDVALRELDNITTASRQIAQGATDPRTIGRLETSVNRLAQTSGTRFGDDVTRLVDDSRELVRSTRNLKTAQESFTNTTRSVAQIPAISDDLAFQSNRLANTISNVSKKATANRSPQIADDLNVLEDVTKQIGSRTENAATIRQAEEALNRLARITNRQLGDDVARVVDDTRQLIRNSRQNGPASTLKSTTDDLVNAGDDLAINIQRTRQQAGSTLSPTITRELDEITKAAKSIGRHGADDSLELSRIQSGLRNIERTGAEGRTIAQSIRRSVDRVQNTTVQSRRALNLQRTTNSAVNSSQQIATIARQQVKALSQNGTPSKFVRRQLDEIAETADNIVTSSNPSVGVKSIQRNIDNLRRSNVAIPEGLERTVRILDDSITSSNAIRHIDASRNFVSNARNLVARTTDDGTTVVAGTKDAVIKSIDDISDDMAALNRAGTENTRAGIIARVDDSIESIRQTGNIKLANELDEAVKIQSLEHVASQNGQTIAKLESTTKALSPNTLAETTSLTTIETIAKEIASGNANPNLLAALERNAGKLSSSNQATLRPIIEELKAGVSLQTKATSELVNASSQVIIEDLARISPRGNVGSQLDKMANIRQRIDLVRHVNGADSALLDQMRSSLISLEDGILSQAQPRLLGQAARWTGSRLGLGTYSPYSIEGLSSTSGKVSALAGKPNNSFSLANKARIILNENPSLVGSAAMNTGLLVGSYFVADHLLKSHLVEINQLAAQLRAEDSSKAATEVTNLKGNGAPEKASFLKVNSEPANNEARGTRNTDSDSDSDVALQFSPAVAEVVRKADFGRISNAALDIIKRTGITGSDHEISQAMHDYRDTGKARRWQALASLPALPVELAQTIVTGFRPIKFREVEAEQPKVTFDRPAPGRFNVMRIRKLMSQLDPKNLAESNDKKDTLYSGTGQSGAGLSANLRMASNSAFSSLNLLQEGIENREPTLDNLASVSGGSVQTQTTFTTYSSPSGLQFAKNTTDPNQNDDEANDEKLYTEALSEANDAIV